jgi:hypothetical protein
MTAKRFELDNALADVGAATARVPRRTMFVRLLGVAAVVTMCAACGHHERADPAQVIRDAVFTVMVCPDDFRSGTGYGIQVEHALVASGYATDVRDPSTGSTTAFSLTETANKAIASGEWISIKRLAGPPRCYYVPTSHFEPTSSVTVDSAARFVDVPVSTALTSFGAALAQESDSSRSVTVYLRSRYIVGVPPDNADALPMRDALSGFTGTLRIFMRPGAGGVPARKITDEQLASCAHQPAGAERGRCTINAYVENYQAVGLTWDKYGQVRR